MDSKEEGFEETNYLDGETSAERQYQKQESMQSTTTSLPESSGPCQAGQVITTAQDAQVALHIRPERHACQADAPQMQWSSSPHPGQNHLEYYADWKTLFGRSSCKH